MDEQDLSNLPLEIIEHIFLFLDGGSLARASGVRTTWRAAYHNIIKSKPVYESCCRKEIFPSALLSIVERLYPRYPVKKVGDIDWLRVYKCWYHWKNISNCNPTMLTLLEEYASHIRCAKVSGDYVVYGTVSEGKLEAYNMRTDEKMPMLYRGLGVVDIDLCNYAYSTLTDDTPKHDAVRLFLKNNHILISPLEGSRRDDIMVQFDGSDRVPELCLEHWLLTVESNYQIKLKSLGYSIQENSHLVWSAKIQSSLFVSVNSTGEVYLGDCEDKLFNDSDVYFKGYEQINNWRQLNHNVTFGVAYTQFHMLFFVVGCTVKAYIPCSHMLAIKAALLHSNKLFLGSSKGILFIFEVDSDEAVLSLCLAKPSWKCKVSDKAIVAIDVQYTSDNVPFVIVATESAIYKLKLF